jgi:hypothetical protein
LKISHIWEYDIKVKLNFMFSSMWKPGSVQSLVSVLLDMTVKLKFIQGDQKVFVHLMITIQNVTSNVQSVPRQSPDIY